MSDLLPILFTRGQNEGIDPRVAPPDVHVVAQNVRWRKDGRPAKRYGLRSISLSGLNSVSGGPQYTSSPVNAITQWSGAPLLLLGSGARQLNGTTWTDADIASRNEISHWGPGERSPVAISDQKTFANASVGYSSGLLLYAWDDGTVTYTCARTPSGSVVISTTAFATATYPRVVSTSSFLYLLTRNGTTLNCTTFDPTTGLPGATVAIGTLNNAGDYFDAVGRGSDFVVVYQSAVNTLTVKLLTAVSSPAVTQTQTIASADVGVQHTKMTIAGTSSSSVFVAWLETTLGTVCYAALANAVTSVSLTRTTVGAATVNNVDQPGVVIDDANNAGLYYGGLSGGGANLSFVSVVNISDSGSVGTIAVHQFCRLASKPFNGPAQGTLGSQDGRYVWVHTHNSDATNSGTLWDTQRTFYLMRMSRGATDVTFRRQLHTPNMVGSTGSFTSHLVDVVNTSTGFGTNTGFFTVLLNTVRFGNAAAECYSVESLSFFSLFVTQRFAARSTVQAGRALQISGGALAEFNGLCEETGFSNFPVIFSVVGGGGGALSSGTYLYVAVFEYLDTQGRRHRSAPSDPFTFASGANTSATLQIETLIAQSKAANVSVHVYRTLVGGTTYHRVTPNVGAPNAFSGTFVTYVDLMGDTAAAANEFIYTDGGVIPNQLPPPCTFMCLCNGRLWLGGQLDRCVLTSSKLLVDGEPTQFGDPSDFEFEVFLPENNTGLASLDGTLVAFAREAIYLVTGDGPDDQGVGGYNPPQKLPCDVGCIDWRSVVETSIGVFFQSKRGIYLLPRGFNAPVFIGAEVEDTLASFPICKSATLVSAPANASGQGEITVRFVMTDTENGVNTACLVYDLKTQGWSVDTNIGVGSQGPGGTWLDTFVQSGANTGSLNLLFAEDRTTYAISSTFIPTKLGTGDIRPFGVAGYGGFDHVVLVGEFRGAANVNVSVSVDGATADVYPFQVTAADAPDGSVYLDVTPKVRLGSSIRVTVVDATSSGPTEGFIAQALFIESETIGKTKRLAAARKA